MQIWLQIICVDEQYSKLYETSFGEDAIDKILDDVIKESEHYSKVIETQFNKPFVMTEKIMNVLKILLNFGFSKSIERRWSESKRS